MDGKYWNSLTLAALFTLSQAPLAGVLSDLNAWASTTNNRSHIQNTSFFSQTFSKQEAQQVVSLLWQVYGDSLRGKLQTEWQASQFNYDSQVMKLKKKMVNPKSGTPKSLVISMHGGGNTTPDVNDQQWLNQYYLADYYNPVNALWVAPRAPTDSWNMWHQNQIDVFFNKIIESAILFEGVDPNRIYIMGYSAGGDGTYQIGSRMADRWAAALASAGHPNEVTPDNFMNLPVAVWVGSQDVAYDRAAKAVEWKSILDSYAQYFPGLYQHQVGTPATTHWMNYLDTVAMSWGQQFKRNAYPDTVYWKQDDVICDRSYWIQVNPASAVAGSKVMIKRVGQIITIQESSYDSLSLLLNDQMLNLDQEIEVIYDGSTIYRGIPTRNIATTWESLIHRADTTSLYTAKLTLDLKNPSHNFSSSSGVTNTHTVVQNLGFTQTSNQIKLWGDFNHKVELKIFNSAGQIYFQQVYESIHSSSPVISLDSKIQSQPLWMTFTSDQFQLMKFKLNSTY